MNTFNDLPYMFESADDGGGMITFRLAESRELVPEKHSAGYISLICVLLTGHIGRLHKKISDGRRILAAAFLSLLFSCLTACAIRSTSSGLPAILLFNGSGTSPNDVAAIEKILNENDFSYTTANSRRLNEMSESQIRAYRLLIVPGGNFEQIGNGLTSSATANVRNAVHSGLNYLGICAGAFFAGETPYNGLNLTSGVKFTFYALEDHGVRKAAVEIAIAGSPALTHYWEDGPQLTGWGDVVGKYPDGTPAIVEGKVGDGCVILSGVHPEAPESWRHGLTFNTQVSADNAYAATLISAAMNRIRLEHY